MACSWFEAVNGQMHNFWGFLGPFGGGFSNILCRQRALEGFLTRRSKYACGVYPPFPFLSPFEDVPLRFWGNVECLILGKKK